MTKHSHANRKSRKPKRRGGGKNNRILTLIGVFKLLKAAMLIALGAGAFKLLHHDLGKMVCRWAAAMRLDPEDRITKWLLSAVAGVGDRKLVVVGVGTFFYAGLFITEGVGLVRHRRWAEYFTVVTTGLLMPLELYELVHRPTIVRGIVLLLNAAMVVYLIVQLRRGSKTEST